MGIQRIRSGWYIGNAFVIGAEHEGALNMPGATRRRFSMKRVICGACLEADGGLHLVMVRSSQLPKPS